jgi:Amt family ammonium transporter
MTEVVHFPIFESQAYSLFFELEYTWQPAYGDGWNGVAGPVKGLFYGDASQFVAQVIGVGANLVYVGVMGYIVFKLIDVTVGHRVNPMDEVEGLDIPEMGLPGYVGVKLDKYSETPMSR